ncbi:unnamed protein product [Protopolystoma xenopodis]|uniref:Uncharacterized protein n=1 Tax=Protopolystoma xenopodis TaxID=117903 RepID=A0A3S5BM05_9PLAT|nr:unnamed protein product [Protopolystoma xenopodis]
MEKDVDTLEPRDADSTTFSRPLPAGQRLGASRSVEAPPLRGQAVHSSALKGKEEEEEEEAEEDEEEEEDYEEEDEEEEKKEDEEEDEEEEKDEEEMDNKETEERVESENAGIATFVVGRVGERASGISASGVRTETEELMKLGRSDPLMPSTELDLQLPMSDAKEEKASTDPPSAISAIQMAHLPLPSTRLDRKRLRM